MPVPESAPLDRDLLRDRAHAALRDAIVAGTLAPGERLRDAELCEWLGLSRTPVREALGRLEQDGLVETAPQRFTRVAPLDRRDARDAFPIVAALHALAAELAVPRLTAADLVAMDEANARFAAALRGAGIAAGGAAVASRGATKAARDGAALRGAGIAAGGAAAAKGRRGCEARAADVNAALAADDAFHGVFVAASANAELPRALDRLMPRIRRLERARFGSLPGRRSVAQHDEIARAAAAGDAARTAALVRENWLSLGALIDRTFNEEGP